MKDWFLEYESEHLLAGYKFTKQIFSGQSDFQKIEVIDTLEYGKMMIIDGMIMVTENDEFAYHEMISHVPLCFHECPKTVLVIGGGDGGTVRELLRYPQIEKIILCEIDKMVIDVAKEFFPSISCGLDDPRVEVRIADGIAYIKTLQEAVDVILVDSTDPVGPGEGLFTGAFYQNCAKALRKNGILAAQSESPWMSQSILKRIYNNICTGFAAAFPYTGATPTYPRGYWSWTLAGQDKDLLAKFDPTKLMPFKDDLQYLSPSRITPCFDLAPHHKRKLDL